MVASRLDRDVLLCMFALQQVFGLQIQALDSNVNGYIQDLMFLKSTFTAHSTAPKEAKVLREMRAQPQIPQSEDMRALRKSSNLK
jgi:hypothetical protein